MKSNVPNTTAVVVNFFSAEFTLKAVQSVYKSNSLGPVNIIVIDNSCNRQEHEILNAGLPGRSRLIKNEQNIGFGRACNQAFKHSTDSFFLLLNPDAFLLDGALYRLQSLLMDNQTAGAASPQAFWDEGLNFFIPPAHVPLLFLLQAELGQCGPNSWLYSLVSRLWRRYSLKVWRAERPMQVNNLCGGHVLLKRNAVLAAGGLFDPDFFLYFEDTDLFMRMRKAGFKLFTHPKAKTVHYYDQCDPENRELKKKHMAQAHLQFVEKHKASIHLVVKKMVSIFKHQCFKKNMQPNTLIQDPLKLSVPEDLHLDWLFEWSPNPDFIPAVGCFGQGKEMHFPEHCLQRLAAGRYYMRFSEPKFWSKVGPVLIWDRY